MNRFRRFQIHFTISAILVGSFSLPVSAQEKETRKGMTAAGDSLHVDFTLPFEKALKKAKKENRLLFLKPIYGGVDEEGANDYRCGSW